MRRRKKNEKDQRREKGGETEEEEKRKGRGGKRKCEGEKNIYNKSITRNGVFLREGLRKGDFILVTPNGPTQRCATEVIQSCSQPKSSQTR